MEASLCQVVLERRVVFLSRRLPHMELEESKIENLEVENLEVEIENLEVELV